MVVWCGSTEWISINQTTMSRGWNFSVQWRIHLGLRHHKAHESDANLVSHAPSMHASGRAMHHRTHRMVQCHACPWRWDCDGMWVSAILNQHAWLMFKNHVKHDSCGSYETLHQDCFASFTLTFLTHDERSVITLTILLFIRHSQVVVPVIDQLGIDTQFIRQQ